MRIKRQNKSLTMYQRFFRVIIGIVVTALLILGTSIYVLVYTIIKADNEKANVTTLSVSERVLIDKINTFKSIGRMILSNPNVQEQLGKLGENAEEDYFIPIRSTAFLYEALSDFTSEINNIQSIYLYDKYGRLFFLDSNMAGVRVQEKLSYDSILKSDWYKKVQESDGKEVFFTNNVISNSSIDTFSCAKVLKNLDNFQDIGLLILNIRKDSLAAIFPDAVGNTDCYMIADAENGNILYQNRNLQAYKDIINSNALPSLSEIEDNGFVQVSISNQKLGWNLIYLIKKSELFRKIKLIGFVAVVILCFTILGAALAAKYLAGAITRPLKQLNALIIEVGQGKRNLKEDFRDDEIGKIGKEFCKMVTDKLEADEKLVQFELMQKDAEFQLLQSQINPHFLYNALDSIYWMAILKKENEIAEMTNALSETFKLNLNKGEKITTVRKELDLIKDYLTIQNFRYDGKFAYDLNVAEDLMDYPIIKLILEPFVENAVIHGIEPKCGDGHIWISGYLDRDKLIFCIKDDGIGTEKQEEEWNGYGIRNVVGRIHLYYGPEYGIKFHSSRTDGTEVTVCIPYQKERG